MEPDTCECEPGFGGPSCSKCKQRKNVLKDLNFDNLEYGFEMPFNLSFYGCKISRERNWAILQEKKIYILCHSTKWKEYANVGSRSPKMSS